MPVVRPTIELGALVKLIDKCGRGGMINVDELGLTASNCVEKLVPKKIRKQGLKEAYVYLVSLLPENERRFSDWSGLLLWSKRPQCIKKS